tara:strand:- start:23796 stop:24656 length:861 start_codon:yes stop_codon:yes gene_type:complete
MRKYDLNQTAVVQSFSQAAAQYDQLAVLQRNMGDELLERLSLIKIEPQTIVDLGCGTGELTYQLQQRYPDAKVIGIDAADNMISVAKQQHPDIEFYTAFAEQTHLSTDSVDLIVSNAMLQWTQPDPVFQECRRLLKQEGLLMFTTFGPDTLQELRYCWAQIDDAVHVNRFMDMHDMGDALVKAKFADPVMDMYNSSVIYPDVLSLMRYLKALGAHNVNSGRRKTLLSRASLNKLDEHYAQFSDGDNVYATFEVIHGHAWGPDVTVDQTANRDGVVNIPINRITRKS